MESLKYLIFQYISHPPSFYFLGGEFFIRKMGKMEQLEYLIGECRSTYLTLLFHFH